MPSCVSQICSHRLAAFSGSPRTAVPRRVDLAHGLHRAILVHEIVRAGLQAAHAMIVITVILCRVAVVCRVVHHNVPHRLRAPGAVIVRVASNKFHLLLPPSFWCQRRRKICSGTLCRIIAWIAGHLCDVHAHLKSPLVMAMSFAPSIRSLSAQIVNYQSVPNVD